MFENWLKRKSDIQGSKHCQSSCPMAFPVFGKLRIFDIDFFDLTECNIHHTTL